MNKLILLFLVIYLIGCNNNSANQKKKNVKNNTLDNSIINIPLEEYVNQKKKIQINCIVDSLYSKSTRLSDYLTEVSSGQFNAKSKNVKIDTIHLDSINLLLNSDDYKYDFVKYINSFNSYLISYESIENMEIYGYWLLNKQSGEVVQLYQYPYFSEDGKQMIIVGNYGDPEIYTTLIFYNVKNQKIVKEKEYWERDLQVDDIIWHEDKILLKTIIPDNTEKYYSFDENSDKHNEEKINDDFKIVVQTSNKKNIIIINKAIEEIEIVKPKIIYQGSEIINSCEIYLLEGKRTLIWVRGESSDGGMPNYSMLYDLSGKLLAYICSIRRSVVDFEEIASEGDFDDVLNQYKIDMGKQINKDPLVHVGLW